MPLLTDVQGLCRRLAGHGWADLLRRHGLDITAPDLAAELSRRLPGIDRTAPGFDDVSPDAVRGVEPGSPARSLLYHALASPLVHPQTSTGLPAPPEAYPTLAELDTVENYVYAVAGRQLSDFPGAVVAVFAYQYRSGARSPHRLYADLAFSRTGVARVGTAPDHYDRARRSFRPEGPADTAGQGPAPLAVMPARYAAFLAVARTPHATDAVLEGSAEDAQETFLFPVHKLFPGRECLRDVRASLSLRFREYHRNEKLRRAHLPGNLPLPDGFRVDAPPYLRDSRNAGDLVTLRPEGAAVLLVPRHQPALVRLARQRNSRTRRDEIARFTVPAATADNRFWTSHQMTGGTRTGRSGPEYVNIRHRVRTAAGGAQTVEDLNATLDDAAFGHALAGGGYEAAHFEDDTCDGCLVAEVTGLPGGRRTRSQAAYSLVTAPDFFPLVDQIAVKRWLQGLGIPPQAHFRQGGPRPLAEGRFPANPHLSLPDAPAIPAFSRTDRTMSAVVAVGRSGTSGAAPERLPDGADFSVSFLPDAASSVFAPGWDISLASEFQGEFARFGLGSPFPEDAKLCAALNSFWPALAPDAARTFGLTAALGPFVTAIPMLDGELGWHPQHPAVRSQLVASRPGWDGEFGPFLEQHNGALFVNVADRDRSDYTANAAAGQMHLAELWQVSSEELIWRIEALRACIPVLPPAGDRVTTTELLLVSAERVADWGARADRGDPRLQGPGFLYVFAGLDDAPPAEATGDRRRRRQRVTRAAGGGHEVYTCQLSRSTLCWRQDQGPFQVVGLP